MIDTWQWFLFPQIWFKGVLRLFDGRFIHFKFVYWIHLNAKVIALLRIVILAETYFGTSNTNTKTLPLLGLLPKDTHGRHAYLHVITFQQDFYHVIDSVSYSWGLIWVMPGLMYYTCIDYCSESHSLFTTKKSNATTEVPISTIKIWK